MRPWGGAPAECVMPHQTSMLECMQCGGRWPSARSEASTSLTARCYVPPSPRFAQHQAVAAPRTPSAAHFLPSTARQLGQREGREEPHAPTDAHLLSPVGDGAVQRRMRTACPNEAYRLCGGGQCGGRARGALQRAERSGQATPMNVTAKRRIRFPSAGTTRLRHPRIP